MVSDLKRDFKFVSGSLPAARRQPAGVCRQLAGACRQPAGRLLPDAGAHLPSSKEEADFGWNLRHKVHQVEDGHEEGDAAWE